MMNLNYNKVLEMVNYVLFSYDLADVIVDECCQEDEYISEAKEITNYIINENELSILGLSNFIQDLFVNYFETVYSFEVCTDMSYDIENNLKFCEEVK